MSNFCISICLIMSFGSIDKVFCQISSQEELNKQGLEYLMNSEKFVFDSPDSANLYTSLAADCFLESKNYNYYYLSLLGVVNLNYTQKKYSQYLEYFNWYSRLIKVDTVSLKAIQPAILNSKAVFYFSTGREKLGLKNLILAIKAIEPRLKYFPKLSVYHSNLSEIYFEHGDYYRSFAELEKSMHYLSKLDVGNPKVQDQLPNRYFSLGKLKYKRGDFIEAKEDFLRSFELLEFYEHRNKNFKFKNQYVSINLDANKHDEAKNYCNDLNLSQFSTAIDSFLFVENTIRLDIKFFKRSSFKHFQILKNLLLGLKNPKERIKHKIRYLQLCLLSLELTENDYNTIQLEFESIFRELISENIGIKNIQFLEFLTNKILFDLAIKNEFVSEDFLLLKETFSSLSTKIKSIESRLQLNNNLIKIQALAFEKTNLDIKDMFELLELNKSNNLLKDIFEQKYKKSILNNDLLSQLYNQQQFINYLSEEKAISEKFHRDTINILQIKNEISKAQVDFEYLESQIDSIFPEYSNFVLNPKTYTTSEIQKTLAPQDLLLETVLTDSTCHLFFISHNEITHKKIEGKSFLNLKESITNYTSSFSNPKKRKNEIEIISKILDDLDLSCIKEKKRLIIVPDGFLYKIPFELLEINGAPLYENHAISYQYSYKLYLILKEQGKNRQYQKDFVGVSFPVNQSIASAERLCDNLIPSKLACTQQEIETIENIIGLENKKSDLTTDEFINTVEGAKIIHIASHACPDEENHQLSRIHFKDDYLTNYDISAMNIDADIAVLSACETGSGKILDGEGAMTIAKAFFQAGVHTNIVSLWKVDDCSTAELMSYFYKHLYQGEDSDVALQNAKKDFLANTHPQYHDPYYWAGFIHMGATDPVFKKSDGKLLYLGLAGILGLGFILLGRKTIKEKAA